MRVLVTGGRDFDDALTLGSWLGGINNQHGISLLIEGNCPTGADNMARRFAAKYGIQSLSFAADWATHGKAAGPIRNQKMLDESKPDIVVAFKGGKGTADMVRRARKAGVRVLNAYKISVPS